jgi:hypothetical protein
MLLVLALVVKFGGGSNPLAGLPMVKLEPPPEPVSPEALGCQQGMIQVAVVVVTLIFVVSIVYIFSN